MKKVLVISNSATLEPFLCAIVSACSALPKFVYHAASFLAEIGTRDYELVLFQLDVSDKKYIPKITSFIKGTFPKSKLIFFAGTFKGVLLPSLLKFEGFIERDASMDDYQRIIGHVLNDELMA